MPPGQSIRPGSTTQLVPYTPYEGDWTEREDIRKTNVFGCFHSNLSATCQHQHSMSAYSNCVMLVLGSDQLTQLKPGSDYSSFKILNDFEMGVASQHMRRRVIDILLFNVNNGHRTRF